VTTTVVGADRLAATLRGAADDIRDLSAAQQSAGRLVEQRSRSGAPVRTGALARSIRSSTTGAEVHVTSPLRYAGVQEYGSNHTPAHPYMRPALSYSTPIIVGLYEADVQRALAKVKGA
jgi:HK97 gp10 family phage protein